MSKKYFEIKYNGPYKGMHSTLPEDIIGKEYSPFMENIILKNGEIRPRPRINSNLIPGTPDGLPILVITSFQDSNNVVHTVAVTGTGLWQLNPHWNIGNPTAKKTWNLIGNFNVQPGPNYPAATSVFVNKFFWSNGGNNLWQWDGISSIGSTSRWQKSTSYLKGARVIDSNKNIQIAGNSGTSGTVEPAAWGNTLGPTGGAQTIDNTGNPIPVITWTYNGKNINPSNSFVSAAIVDVTNGITAGGFFLIELNSQLLLLNTTEGPTNGAGTQSFTQRIRWCPSGLPTIWDPLVNLGAGFNDELDVSDNIMGAMTVGTTAFIFRNNGITEVTSTGNGVNPFTFNHLWASDRGIGNIFPFGYASYGPLGIFISSDDVYNVSLGGFKKIGGVNRDAIFADLYITTGTPIASIVPAYQGNYVYNEYRLAIPQGFNTVLYRYSIDDDSWQRDYLNNKIMTGISRYSFTR